MAEKRTGVLIKPLVRDELSRYKDGYGNTRDYKNYNDSLPVSKLKITPTLGTLNKPTSSITFRALVRSEEERNPNDAFGVTKNKINRKGKFIRAKIKKAKFKHVQYLVTIRFHEIRFVENESPIYKVPWKIGFTTYYAKTIAIQNNPVMMRCNCRDFSFTWEKPLADQGGLWPNNVWSKYVPVPGSDREPRNPDNRMGYCKHIQTFLVFLYDSELIRNK